MLYFIIKIPLSLRLFVNVVTSDLTYDGGVVPISSDIPVPFRLFVNVVTSDLIYDGGVVPNSSDVNSSWCLKWNWYVNYSYPRPSLSLFLWSVFLIRYNFSRKCMVNLNACILLYSSIYSFIATYDQSFFKALELIFISNNWKDISHNKLVIKNHKSKVHNKETR